MTLRSSSFLHIEAGFVLWIVFNCSRKVEAQVEDQAHGVITEAGGDEKYGEHYRPEDKLDDGGDGCEEHKEGERTNDDKLGYERAEYGVAVYLVYVAVFLRVYGRAVGDEIEEAEGKLHTEELVKGCHKPRGRLNHKLAYPLNADGGYTGE